MRKLALSVALLGLMASPALACINDSVTVPHERQFKSSYIDQPAEQPAPATSPGEEGSFLGPLAAASTGGLLLFGALVVGVVRSGRRP